MPSPNYFLFIINPIAGTKNKKNVVLQIETYAKSHAARFEIVESHPAGNYEAIKEKIITERFTHVIIGGGDGTVNQVIAALHTLSIAFGILPLGSGNGLAYCAGVPRNIKQAIKIAFTVPAVRVDAFKINGRFGCMLAGFGFDAQVAHDFAKKQTRGLLTYTQQSLLNYFKMFPYQFEVEVDNFSFFTEAFFISIANSNQFGNHMTIAPKASLNDGLLDIVIVQKMNRVKLPFAVLRQMRGNNKLQALVDSVSTKSVLYFQTPRIVIRNLKIAPFHIDGEPMPSKELYEIEILRDCFALIKPKKN